MSVIDLSIDSDNDNHRSPRIGKKRTRHKNSITTTTKKVRKKRSRTVKKKLKRISAADRELLVEHLSIVNQSKLHNLFAQLIRTNDDVASAMVAEFPVPKLDQRCLLCGVKFDNRYPEGCVIHHEFGMGDGYDRGECPVCGDWDCCESEKCGRGCGSGHCDGTPAGDEHCYAGPHISDPNDLPEHLEDYAYDSSADDLVLCE